MNILDKMREKRDAWIVLRKRNELIVELRILPDSLTVIKLSYKIPGGLFQSHLIRIEDMSRIVHEFRWDESRKGNIASGLMIEHDHGTVIGENGDILRTIRKYIN